ncbi:MAG: aminotransferase class V-fold PLP-dependent enzyme [Pseudonocardiaceae bacterium]
MDDTLSVTEQLQRRAASLWLVELAHRQGYDALFDAVAYLLTTALDLSVVAAEFVTVSWYKLFGYPTGVGCLIARREALTRRHPVRVKLPVWPGRPQVSG